MKFEGAKLTRITLAAEASFILIYTAIQGCPNLESGKGDGVTNTIST